MTEDISSYQEQSQAQRELWMMEDILAGLKVNRDHFRFLMGLQRHHSKHQLSLTVMISLWLMYKLMLHKYVMVLSLINTI